MKAAWIEEFGGPEVIRIGSREVPERKSGELLVRIAATTLNHHDIYLRRGEAGRVQLPVVLGSDGAGTVVDADPSSAYERGSRIAVYPVLSCGRCRNCAAGQPHKCVSFGMVGGERDGTHAELIAIPEACAVPLPNGLDYDNAAAISLAGVTAWNMVVDESGIREGDHALVLGASGGVGVFTVMLLKRAGAIVHAVTSSPSKADRLREIGADHVLSDDAASVLRHTRNLPDRGVRAAFNCVGGSTWRYVPAAVAAGGAILVCGSVRNPAAELDMRQVFYRSLTIIGCTMGRRESLEDMLAVAAVEPSFRAPIHDIIGLEALALAHTQMEAGKLTGKIVIHPVSTS